MWSGYRLAEHGPASVPISTRATRGAKWIHWSFIGWYSEKPELALS
jgi:hypothetical protein